LKSTVRRPWFVRTIVVLDFVGVLVLLLVLDPYIETWCRALRLSPQGHDVVFWRDLMDGAKYLGRGVTQFLFALGLLALGILVGHRPLWRLGTKASVAVAASGLLNVLFKFLLGRPRPRMHYFAHNLGYDWETFLTFFNFKLGKAYYLPWMGPSFNADFSSFPSGHAMTSFALAVVLARALPKQRVLFYGLAVYIAAFRVVGSSHFASDIYGGALLGLAVGWLVNRFLFPDRSQVRAEG
jgi:membrane-associated phospholipid phosphatase